MLSLSWDVQKHKGKEPTNLIDINVIDSLSAIIMYAKQTARAIRMDAQTFCLTGGDHENTVSRIYPRFVEEDWRGTYEGYEDVHEHEYYCRIHENASVIDEYDLDQLLDFSPDSLVEAGFSKKEVAAYIRLRSFRHGE